MKYAGASLLVLLLRQPHRAKRWQARHDRPTDPSRDHTVRRRAHADLCVAGGQEADLAEQALGEPRHQRGPASENDVLVERAAEIDLRALNAVDEHLMNTFALVTNKTGLEKYLWRHEPFWPNLFVDKKREMRDYPLTIQLKKECSSFIILILNSNGTSFQPNFKKEIANISKDIQFEKRNYTIIQTCSHFKRYFVSIQIDYHKQIHNTHIYTHIQYTHT